MGKGTDLDGFDELFFWGRETVEEIYTEDKFVYSELLDGLKSDEDIANDRNLLTLQRVLLREILYLDKGKLSITIFGVQSWSYKLIIKDKLVLENEAKYPYTPIWIWWREFVTFVEMPSKIDFEDGGLAYTSRFTDGDLAAVSESDIDVTPNIPGVREWPDKMQWKNFGINKQFELAELLVGVLAENEMLPMEVLLCLLIIHPDTSSEVITFIEKIDEKLDLPKSVIQSLMLR